MLKGLPASGKSTRAKEQVKSGLFKRVNKDDLRMMIDGGKRSKQNELIVLSIRDNIIRNTLTNGTGILVDDTNFAPQTEEYLRNIAESFGAKFVIKFFDTPVQECVKRDSERSNPVGSKVIWDMYRQYLKTDKQFIQLPVDNKLIDAIICDIDGTLAKHVARGPFEMEKLDTDEVIEQVKRIINLQNTRYSPIEIILMSGRGEEYRIQTQKWLSINNIVYDELYMRPLEDKRPDTEIKKELYEKYIKDKYNVLFAIDDRIRIVDQRRNMGIFTFDVNQTREEF